VHHLSSLFSVYSLVDFTIKLSKAERLESWQDTQITEKVSEDLGKRSTAGGLIMTGHHKFSELIKNLLPERQAKIEEKTAQLKQKITLSELIENENQRGV
jgi:hypothetical protein